MAYRIGSNDAFLIRARLLAAQGRNLRPMTAKLAVFVARMARRKAPVYRGWLRRSLNAATPNATTVILQSPLPYAGIQARGGRIRAGTGKLGAKLLAIPLHEDARRMVEKLGASVSLRTQNLIFVRTRRGQMLLIKQLKIGSGRRRRKRGQARRYRFHDAQVMFLLKPRVRLEANPPPEGYLPDVRDPELRVFMAKVVRQHLRGD